MSAVQSPKPIEKPWEARRWCHGDSSFTKWQPCTEAQMHAWRSSNGGYEFRRAALAKARPTPGEGA